MTTLVTLGSWRGSLLVMMCVLLTTLDVAGFMHWWGLTIDITSMNVLIISVGLCVDFCAHIVHGFLTGHGSKGSYQVRMIYNMLYFIYFICHLAIIKEFLRFFKIIGNNTSK